MAFDYKLHIRELLLLLPWAGTVGACQKMAGNIKIQFLTHTWQDIPSYYGAVKDAFG